MRIIFLYENCGPEKSLFFFALGGGGVVVFFFTRSLRACVFRDGFGSFTYSVLR